MAKRCNLQDIIEKANEVHDSRYSYELIKEYHNNREKLPIICPVHGTFYQSMDKHIRLKQGCPMCAKNHKGNKENFLKRAKEIHGNEYDYSKVEYVNNYTPVEIICKIHGSFFQTPHAHIDAGHGCPKCAGFQKNNEDFIREAQKIHKGKYSYDKVQYLSNKDKVCITCPIHGDFYQTPANHLMGKGCPKCGNDTVAEKLSLTKNEFINKAKKIHFGKGYDFSKVEYVNNSTKVCIICPDHGEFWITPSNLLSGEGCPVCSAGNHASKIEREICRFLNDFNIKTETSKRDILSDNQEIDIFLPNFNIGIECDGVYWHSEKFKTNNYHLKKTEECLKKDIRLIHIFDDEWLYEQNKVKNRLLSILGLNKGRIYARKCSIGKVDTKIKSNFLNEYHLQGNAQSSVNIGLYYDGELVSLMTFSKPRINVGGKKNNNNDDVWELVRFCNKEKCNVVGGASKLLKYFIDEYKPDEIKSYADRRWSIGNVYEKIGFKKTEYSKPNYFYVINGKRKNRFGFRKSELMKKYGCDKDISEHQFMLSHNLYRIYDCGTIVYKWKNKKYK